VASATIDGAVEAGAGLSAAPADPLRYNNQPVVWYESPALTAAAVPPGSRVLDVGCGTGSVSVLVRDRQKAEIVGVEPSPERAELARSRGLTVHTSLFPAPDVPADGSFDVVLFADVLEHLVDPGAALLAARRYLRPGGWVVASLPNVAHWTVRWDLLWGKFRYQPYGMMDATHLRWFTREGLDQLLAAAGFEVEHYAGAAGLYEYLRRWPWRWARTRGNAWLAPKLIRLWPTMFAYQHVVRARMISPSP
jgi:methionine biosynthesis protein MetW